jgi:hypothetical protein
MLAMQLSSWKDLKVTLVTSWFFLSNQAVTADMLGDVLMLGLLS